MPHYFKQTELLQETSRVTTSQGMLMTAAAEGTAVVWRSKTEGATAAKVEIEPSLGTASQTWKDEAVVGEASGTMKMQRCPRKGLRLGRAMVKLQRADYLKEARDTSLTMIGRSWQQVSAGNRIRRRLARVLTDRTSEEGATRTVMIHNLVLGVKGQTCRVEDQDTQTVLRVAHSIAKKIASPSTTFQSNRRQIVRIRKVARRSLLLCLRVAIGILLTHLRVAVG